MAKSIKSKVKRKFRAARRAHLDEVLTKHQLEDISLTLNKVIKQLPAGPTAVAKSKFLYPSDAEATVGKKTYQKPVDFRLAVENVNF